MKTLAYRIMMAVAIGALLGVYLALSGCAGLPRVTHDQCNATKFATAHEHELCLEAADAYEQAQHEREDRRLIRLDKLIIMLNACDKAPGLSVYEKRYGGSLSSCLPNSREMRKAVKTHGYPYTHDNVCNRPNTLSIMCVKTSDLIDAMNRAY